MMQKLISLTFALFILGGGLPAAHSQGQSTPAEPYPSKPVRLIVPYSPGGGTDILARLFARVLASDWNAAVVVENHAGANTDIGTLLVARAAADGHALLLATPANVINPQLSAKPAYEFHREFVPVALLGDVPNVLLVRASLPVSRMDELLGMARNRPGDLTYASGGVGSPQHFSLELLKQVAKLDIRHIPYKGGGPATTDLLAGHVDMMASSAVLALPHIKSGKVRALVVASSARLSSAPDVPTAAEVGIPNFQASTWFGIAAPAGTPAAVVTRINQSVRRAMALPEVIESLGKLGADPNQWSDKQFADWTRSEAAKWGASFRPLDCARSSAASVCSALQHSNTRDGNL